MTEDGVAQLRDPAAAALTNEHGRFLRYGAPHRIVSGSLHYFRVHPEHWRDRLSRLKAMGLNTVDTYVPWNFHESVRGSLDFSEWRDLDGFVALAAQQGLDVIVRPGPYICAEWDNGGFPAWLTGTPGMVLRASYRPYLDEVARWFDALIPRIAALQSVHGGPIVAVQVENEYGSYGDDHAYMRWMRDALVSRGVVELLYTADGPTPLMLDGGALPGTLATATFGSHASDAAALLASRRTSEPFMCAEFWNGWFDHWGENHHIRAAADAASTLADVLDARGSVSIYMAHGGTNFGLWSGANHDGSVLQPTVSSYDSDAPIAENGELTEKFFAFRRLLAADVALTLPAEPRLLPVESLTITRGAGLLAGLECAAAAGNAVPVPAAVPPSFDELGQASGLVLYRARPTIVNGEQVLRFRGLHDRAHVFVDGEPAGIVARVDAELAIVGTGAQVQLDVLVENQGRINYGRLLGQGKGILGGVQIERRLIFGWEAISLPLDQWSAEQLDAIVACGPALGNTGFATAQLQVAEPADTFLALPGFGKGFVWINGFLLGRYWEIGPQRTLYLPGPLLQAGENVVTILETEHFGSRLELRTAPELGVTEVFVETF